MEVYAGIDVSLNMSAICVVDAQGTIVKEAKVQSEPEALVGFFRSLPAAPAKIGLEAGPLSQWLFEGLGAAGFDAVLMETRQVKDAFKSRPVKSDRIDARGIAQLVRMNWYKAVHCKSQDAQATRALLTARKQLQTKRHDVEMSLRGILRNFGLKMGKTTARSFDGRARALAQGNAALEEIVEALLAARAALDKQFKTLDRRALARARRHDGARLLATAPGVGAIVGLGFAAAVDDPGRFKKSRSVGAYFGLTQRKDQSGEKDRTGHISKCGDDAVRALLYEAANVILTRPVKGGALKSWAMKLARRVGMKKAKVALARKLAVILHRMLMDGAPFDFARGAAA